MTTTRRTLLALLFCATGVGAQPLSDGTIVENNPCPPNPTLTYEQYVSRATQMYTEDVAAAGREGFTTKMPENVAATLMDRKTFDRARGYAGFECRQIKYMSDGLKVAGFIWKPKVTAGAPRPLVIYNRGGNREFGAVSPWTWSGFFALLDSGFVVVASQYRGNGGGEGREEFGGADVRDILNLIPLAKSLGYVDMTNVFMLGVSRGGMMTFLALKQGIEVNAVATIGALTDMVASNKSRPQLTERVNKELIPDFATRADEAMRERSAVYWPERINVPVLILQGGADWRSDPGTQGLALAQKLQEQGKTYELIVYAGDNHGLMANRLDAERRIISWFRRHIAPAR
jgi:dipeptidyl aminopeptidase/acylaminoacyl peptidase